MSGRAVDTVLSTIARLWPMANDLEITLEDAYKGKTATLEVPTNMLCERCAGSGAKNGAKPRTIASATSLRRLAINKPGSEIIVSRPQSVNHG